ncbi:uncharacterized protein BJ212DRAFT_1298501 [Suillus subaureus]|uniref:Uncharacterized protein n=1 Tax=Suillus subaureus TaxID=48587 RepID=A0A9P7EF53_9AGAM|nr:uncharacterized protein BJ212DRAFT_1298501 [Suillus subaureus]KAG1819270.1 hypothetical protein BJ212DRAFT_1298501 [Suillus subaureus]
MTYGSEGAHVTGRRNYRPGRSVKLRISPTLREGAATVPISVKACVADFVVNLANNLKTSAPGTRYDKLLITVVSPSQVNQEKNLSNKYTANLLTLSDLDQEKVTD